MTNFAKDLRNASFRGVAFEIDSDSKDFGRRITAHEYPGRDTPYHEDMGASVESFSIDAFICGADFISRGDALESALRKAGPGTLMHPHYGELNVIALSATRRHSSTAIGEIVFTINFQIYGGPLYPLALADTASSLGISSSALFSALNGDFSAIYKITGLPDFITQDAQSRLSSIMESVEGLLSRSGLLSYLPAPIPSLISTAQNLATGITGFFQDIGNAPQKKPIPMIATGKSVTAPAPALITANAMLDASALSAADTVMPVTGIRARRVSNARALDNIFQASALAAAAASARTVQYESRDQAIDFRTRFAARMEDVQSRIGADGWDASYRQCSAVLAAVTKDINERIGRLPRTVNIRTSAIRSSLELANRLYGDDTTSVISAAADIARRNRARHPGMIPAKTLEVIIDASGS